MPYYVQITQKVTGVKYYRAGYSWIDERGRATAFATRGEAELASGRGRWPAERGWGVFTAPAIEEVDVNDKESPA